MKTQNNYKTLESQNYLIGSEKFINQYHTKYKNFCDDEKLSEMIRIVSKNGLNETEFCDINGEIAMWKAVILQALVDMSSKSKKKMNRIYRIQSIIWVNMKNKDFLRVCSHAGLDPYYVVETAEKIKKNNPFIQ